MPPHRGFSLNELVIAMAVCAISLALAAPSFSSLLASQRLVGTSNRVLVEIQSARLLAVHSNSRATICGSNDGETCNGSANWSSGTLTFLDTNRNGKRDALEPARRRLYAEDLNGLQIGTSNGRKFLAFTPAGFTAGSNLTVHICAHNRAQWRQIIINLAGRSRVYRPPEPSICPA